MKDIVSAINYAHNKYPDAQEDKISQITNQFLKSNTAYIPATVMH